MKRLAALVISAFLGTQITAFPVRTASAAPLPVSSTAAVSSQQLSEYAEKIIFLTNVQRKANGLEELQVFPLINNAAMKRAAELPSKFDHTRPDGSNCFTVLAECGIPSYSFVAENIAMGYSSPEAVVRAWMNSTGHRANILTPRLKYIGVGAISSGGRYYWVQEFLDSGDSYSGVRDAQVNITKGDVNIDGSTDASDASLVLESYSAVVNGLTSLFTRSQEKAADINSDGTYDASDASQILSYYAYSVNGGSMDIGSFIRAGL